MNDKIREKAKDIAFKKAVPIIRSMYSKSRAQVMLDFEAVALEMGEWLSHECLHPGCCCVCGHKGLCPEDGPSHIEGIED